MGCGESGIRPHPHTPILRTGYCMEKDKVIEFLVVLSVAIFAGAMAWIAITYLKGTARIALFLFIAVGIIVSLQILRKKFGRNR